MLTLVIKHLVCVRIQGSLLRPTQTNSSPAFQLDTTVQITIADIV